MFKDLNEFIEKAFELNIKSQLPSLSNDKENIHCYNDLSELFEREKSWHCFSDYSYIFSDEYVDISAHPFEETNNNNPRRFKGHVLNELAKITTKVEHFSINDFYYSSFIDLEEFNHKKFPSCSLFDKEILTSILTILDILDREYRNDLIHKFGILSILETPFSYLFNSLETGKKIPPDVYDKRAEAFITPLIKKKFLVSLVGLLNSTALYILPKIKEYQILDFPLLFKDLIFNNNYEYLESQYPNIKRIKDIRILLDNLFIYMKSFRLGNTRDSYNKVNFGIILNELGCSGKFNKLFLEH